MKGKKILVLEDDESIRECTRDLLELDGFTVECARNGEDGIRMLRDSSALPDLILLDLMMPVKDGFQFRSEQQRDPKLAQIPVVVLTAGHIDEEDKKLAAKAYLRKPVDIDAILDAVRRSLVSSEPPSDNPKTIVIVDDSLDLTRSYQYVLEEEGYRVFLARSGAEALELLNRIPPPDVLWVDFLMPGMSGVEFLKELEKHNQNVLKNTPIVGLSGVVKESPILEEMRPMVCRIAEKPNDLDDVLKLARETIRK